MKLGKFLPENSCQDGKARKAKKVYVQI